MLNTRKEKNMYIGIDIGGSHIGIGLFDQKKNLIQKIVKPFDPLKGKENLVKILIKELKKFSNIESIGIGVPGIVKDDLWVKANYLQISNYPIVKELQKEIKVPIFLENDSNCAGVGYLILNPEIKFGVFLTIGSGIGGAILFHGNVFSRNNDCIAEFGHLTYQENGRLCSCKRKGCYSQYASMKALRTNIARRKNCSHLQNEDVLSLLKQKDEIALEEFQKQNEILQKLIGNLANILSPQKIILGGSFSYFKKFIPLSFYENKEHWYNRHSDCKIEITDFGNDLGLLGAAFQKDYIRRV